MSFPKDSVRSPSWYDNCFEGAKPSLPADIRLFSESVCNRFTISGICDPMYIANVTAFELGRGDGCGAFFSPDADARDNSQERLNRVLDRLAFAYSSCVQEQRTDLRQIALSTLVF